ncbi:DNA polymerase IV [Actinosynnema sp. NPDC020468]|uniref:DNA polymerase IV n=1 Tax=Actinosynnema sp. NPDC020468 TaxID=3154488 RepID=UPI0033D47A35
MSEQDWVLHVDLDQFVAAVEVARRPELAGRPVVVGGAGDPDGRAVVATASYEARAFGVHSGMPLRVARRKCPEAVFLPTDPDAYQAVSDEVMAALRELPAVVEVIGWDEAFLGVATADPEAFAARVREAVLERTGLSCSVGVGDNKLRAKLATGFAKPAGVYRLTRDNWVAVMSDRPVSALWGIGPRTAAKLAGLEVRTVAELARADDAVLAARFGPAMGPYFRRLALGAGETTVSASPWVARSHSRETTFQVDLTDPEEIREQTRVLARRVAREVAADGRDVVRVAVKVRFAPFLTRVRQVALAVPTRDPAELERAVLVALARFDDGRAVRLVGVRADFAVE